MKKILILLVCCFLVAGSIHAQTWQEWFQQKKTQKLYLIQQIAALKVYLGYARKGYDIANKGITTVRNIKKGDFDLHRTFLEALKLVNPKIRKYAKIADIIDYQVRIIKATNESLQKIRSANQFTPTELDYCKQVLDNLLNECVKGIEELLIVISSSILEMKDDERIKRIDNIHIDMQDKYAFCASFCNEMAVLSAQRLADQVEVNHSNIINGLR